MVDALSVTRAVTSAIVGALLWLALSEGAGWAIGVPAVVAAAASTWLAPPAAGARLAPGALVAFVPWFVARSVAAGADVARRAFRRRMALDPVWVEHPLRLPEGAPVRMFAACASLIPGTLAVQKTGGSLRVHALDRTMVAGLSELEARVARLYRAEPTE